MIAFLKNNIQLIVLLMVWIFAGMQEVTTAYFLVPLGFIVLKNKHRYADIIMAFSLLLFLSDVRVHPLVDIAQETRDIAIVMLSVFVFFDTKQFEVKSRLFMPFVPFLLFAFAVIVKSPDPLNSFQRTVSYALILIAIPNYFIRELRYHREEFLRKIIWFCITYLCVGFLLIIFIPKWVFITGPRFNGLFGSPNGLGTMCTLLTMLIAISRHHFPQIFSKSELYFIALVIIACVIMSSSRNCIFSIGIFLFFMRFYRISYLYGFIIVIVTAIVFQFINENIVYLINSLGLGEFFRVKHLDDGSGRVIAWAFAWEEIQRNFFLGKGFGYDKDYFALYKDYLSVLGHQGGVHNSYLTIWMNTGLIGLILFLAAFLRTFLKAAAQNYLAIPTMFTIMFTISFESWATSSLSPFTIIFLLILTLLQYQKNDTPAEKNLVPV